MKQDNEDAATNKDKEVSSKLMIESALRIAELKGKLTELWKVIEPFYSQYLKA